MQVSGSKNASLPIMAASLLAQGPVTLQRVPRLGDVETLTAVLRALGMECQRRTNGSLTLATVDPTRNVTPRQLVSRMRASICVLGPLLARRGRAVIAAPGGCSIGSRPIDLHLAGLGALGAEFTSRGNFIVARANLLRGTKIDLAGPRGPTVTGTANVLCAASLARGTTIITGAAREPEIVDLADFLKRLGANIEGAGSPTVVVKGVDSLQGGSYKVQSDRIEAGTYLMSAAITGGDVMTRGTNPEQLNGLLSLLADSGVNVTAGESSIRVSGRCKKNPRTVTASPFPGLPTDLQPLLSALMAVGHGSCVVHDCVFPERFDHAEGLRRMGAEILRSHTEVCINGVPGLYGAQVTARDLRGGAAYILAGLAARGITTIAGIRHIDRGYECVEEKLAQIGAQIVRIKQRSGTPARQFRPALCC